MTEQRVADAIRQTIEIEAPIDLVWRLIVIEVIESGFTALRISPEKIAANYDDNTEGWAQELAALKAAARA